MLTYEEFFEVIRTEGQKGCICLECEKCGSQYLWLEGCMKRLYDKLYMAPCRECKDGSYTKVYGGEFPGAFE